MKTQRTLTSFKYSKRSGTSYVLLDGRTNFDNLKELQTYALRYMYTHLEVTTNPNGKNPKYVFYAYSEQHLRWIIKPLSESEKA